MLGLWPAGNNHGIMYYTVIDIYISCVVSKDC